MRNECKCCQHVSPVNCVCGLTSFCERSGQEFDQISTCTYCSQKPKTKLSDVLADVAKTFKKENTDGFEFSAVFT